MDKHPKHPSEVEIDNDTEPKVGINDDVKKKQPNIIWEKLLDNRWLALVPILGLICLIFGINYQSVKSYFSNVKIVSPIQKRSEKEKSVVEETSEEEKLVVEETLREETFFSTLESISAVRNSGGTVNPPNEANFVEGGCGKGFISKRSKEIITFPITEKNLNNLEAGTVELCVTLTRDLAEAADELFLFMAYERDYDAIFLQFIDPESHPIRPVARMRIKRGVSSDPDWVNAESDKLDWKAGEHHHLAGSWGDEGVKLYIDGKRIAHNPVVPVQPTKYPDSFTVNNDSADTGNNPTHCIVRNLRISNYQKDDADVKKSYGSLHREK